MIPTLGEDIAQFLTNSEDLEFEEEIARNPYKLKAWWRYLQAKRGASRKARNILHERALHFLPRSYKLWRQYLGERVAAVADKSVDDPACQIVVNAFERALVHLHKMPRLWLDYTAFLARLQRGTATRRAYDRALQALAITQHHLVWPQYLEWVRAFGALETAVRVYRRYLMLDGARREEYVDYLESSGLWGEAARQLARCVNDDSFVSAAGHSKHQMWMRLCDICAQHPADVSGALKVDAIIRSGISRFTDEVGRLWAKLADYYIRLGQLERARDVYEEAINSIMTVKDFTMAFDAYTRFEETVLSAKMEEAEKEAKDKEANGSDDGNGDDEDDIENDVEMRLARLEHLLERRPLLLSSVLLRQNPHNVHEWQKRAKLFAEDPAGRARCYAQAVQAVDPKAAVGKLSRLWLDFAKFYAEQGEGEMARGILDKATLVPYKNVEELVDVYLEWAQLEIDEGHVAAALRVLQRAVTEPAAAAARRRGTAALGKEEKRRAYTDAPAQERVHRSVRLWDRYLALEAEAGTPATVRAAHDKAMETKVATPQSVLDYAEYLEERKYFEDAFRVYERGVALFEFPHVRPLWVVYLDKFVARYGGTKLERARDLFEQVLAKAPPAESTYFYVVYARFEERHGLTKKLAAVYDRACGAVPTDERLKCFQIYAAMVKKHYSDVQARKVYERAVQELPDDGARVMCMDFAAMEEKLGEVDRARAIWTHGSQFADPRRHADYWTRWHQFEVELGNQDTFREMLRVKRSVQMAFSNVNYMAAEMLSGDVPLQSDAEATAAERRRAEALRLGQTQGELGRKRKAADGGGGGGGAVETSMEALERAEARLRAMADSGAVELPEGLAGGAVDGGHGGGGGGGETAAVAAARDAGEIDLSDGDDGDEGGGGADGGESGGGDGGAMDVDGGDGGGAGGGEENVGSDVQLVQRPIPDAVFGGAKEALERQNGDAADKPGAAVGAMERLKARGK